MIGALVTVAFAGYGDGGVGFPTAEGRQIALWINAARVEPAAFETDYVAGGCSYFAFPVAEQVPQTPYRWHDGLSEVALEHSLDMDATNILQHDSSDGTPWDDRVWPAYPGGTSIAENVAWNYGSAKNTVLRGWMCSSAGHRTSIMSATYVDVGGDMAGDYATADFGGGAGGAFPKVRIGAHEPLVPSNTVDLLADWTDSAAPDLFEVIFDGDTVPMTLRYGAPEEGVYAVTWPVDNSTCHSYWFRAERGGIETRFPETGAYSFGTCAGADPDTGWLDLQIGPTSMTQDDSEWTAGDTITFTVEGAVPGETVNVLTSRQTGSNLCPAGVGGTCLGLRGTLKLLGTDVADNGGTAVVQFVVPAALPAGLALNSQAVIADGLGNWVTTAVVGAVVQ